jgi:hypothetical protein
MSIKDKIMAKAQEAAGDENKAVEAVESVVVGGVPLAISLMAAYNTVGLGLGLRLGLGDSNRMFPEQETLWLGSVRVSI